MSDMHSNFERVSLGFASSGIDTASAEAAGDETALVRTSNALVDVRGNLRKMPHMELVGNAVIEPTKPLASANEKVSFVAGARMSDWNILANNGNEANISESAGGITLSARKSTTGSSFLMTLDLPEMQNNDSAHSKDMTLGFVLRSIGFSSVLLESSTDVGVRISSGIVNGPYHIIYGIDVDGVKVADSASTFTTVFAWPENPVDGLNHRIELRAEYDDSGGSPLYHISGYYDGEPVGTVDTAYMVDYGEEAISITLTTDSSLADSDHVLLRLANVYLRDTASNPSAEADLRSLYGWSFKWRGSEKEVARIFAATDRNMWAIDSMYHTWLPVLALEGVPSITEYDGRVLVCDGQKMYLIDEALSIERLTDAPRVSFCTEHAGRIFAAGDKENRLRLYFSGDRRANVWLSPDTDSSGEETESEVLDAGYIPIPGILGEEITALSSSYRGVLLVFTTHAVHRISGYSIETFSREVVTSSCGAMSRNAVTEVGNDLWFVGQQGVFSLTVTEQFGDLLVKAVSVPVQDLFSPSGPEFRHINFAQASRVSLHYAANTGLLYMAVPSYASQVVDMVFVYNMFNGKWYGPLYLQANALAASNQTEEGASVLIYCTGAGNVYRSGQYDDRYAEMSVLTKRITGRSVNQQYDRMVKTWRNLSIVCAEVGGFDLEVRWRVEDGEWQSRTVQLCVDERGLLSESFELDVSRVSSVEDTMHISIPLAVRGRELQVELITSAPWMSVYACEAEFTPSGYDRS